MIYVNTALKPSSAALPRSDDQRLLPQALPRASADMGFTSAGPTQFNPQLTFLLGGF